MSVLIGGGRRRVWLIRHERYAGQRTANLVNVVTTLANHASTRATQVYDRRSDEVTLDEVELVLI